MKQQKNTIIFFLLFGSTFQHYWFHMYKSIKSSDEVFRTPIVSIYVSILVTSGIQIYHWKILLLKAAYNKARAIVRYCKMNDKLVTPYMKKHPSYHIITISEFFLSWCTCWKFKDKWCQKIDMKHRVHFIHSHNRVAHQHCTNITASDIGF